MKTTPHLLALLLAPVLLLAGCAATQEARTAGVESRQQRMDDRTTARQDRWKVRAEHEDARADAMFDTFYGPR
jgi:PBP1b-binding outer membrane lipoprotein LpoB